MLLDLPGRLGYPDGASLSIRQSSARRLEAEQSAAQWSLVLSFTVALQAEGQIPQHCLFLRIPLQKSLMPLVLSFLT